MRRIILHISAAFIAFIFGVIAHGGTNALGGLAVEKLYDLAAPAELGPVTLLAGPRSVPADGHDCGYLLVTVGSNGALYLNEGTEAQGLSTLTSTLRTIFERRQFEKTVYIKAARETSYGEVIDLIEALKAAGADPIGLVAARSAAQND